MFVCIRMNMCLSGRLNRYEQAGIVLAGLLREEHKRHPSPGYHRPVQYKTESGFL